MLIGLCPICFSHVHRGVIGGVKEYWCSSCHIVWDLADVIIPVDFDSIPEDLNDSDPEAMGQFVTVILDSEIRTEFTVLIGA